MQPQIIEHHFRQTVAKFYNPVNPAEPILERQGRYVDLARLDNGKGYRLYHGIVEKSMCDYVDYADEAEARSDMKMLIEAYFSDAYLSDD